MLILSVLYCLAIVAASLAGGWIPALFQATHRRMELAVSFVAGVMLGIGLLHLAPHAFEQIGQPHHAAYAVLAGLLTMFFVERFFCFHHHDAPPTGANTPHDHEHNHAHHHPPGAVHHHHELTWSGAAIGLTLHTLIAGAALAASIEHEYADHQERTTPAGLAMFLVILLHKPFDSLTLGTLMTRDGWPAPWRQAVNVLFALVLPIGMGLFYALGAGIAEDRLVGWTLAFSAGVFLCIALSDLLPELQFHQHDRLKLSLALLAGIGVAIAVAVLEGATHGH